MSRLSFKQLAILPALLLAFTLTAQEYDFNFNFPDISPQRNPCKVFIGVITSPVANGLHVDNTLENTPAKASGVQTGDVILALDGTPVRTQDELLQARNKHQAGEAFTLTVLRQGNTKIIQARFKECSAEEQEVAQQSLEGILVEHATRMAEMEKRMQEKFQNFEMTERPILGIYENSDVNVNGVVVGTVIPGKGAEAAGLQSGDVVVKVDGKPVTGSVTLRNALNNHKPGDHVSLVYLRDGNTIQAETVLSADRGYFTQRVERDPCKVFIGVYTSGHALEGRGTRVDGVIDDTPAKIAGIQPGDVILALNSQAVNTHQELTAARDKNKPGDAFRLSILRNGVAMEVNAKFKSCDTPGDAPVQETVEVLEETNPAAQRENPVNLDNSLKLELLEAYPSPTYGPLNINFKAEPVPTSVQIQDISGRTVYSKELPQFGGSFNEQVNLSNHKAGNYVLSIRQGGKVFAKQLVLLPRA